MQTATPIISKVVQAYRSTEEQARLLLQALENCRSTPLTTRCICKVYPFVTWCNYMIPDNSSFTRLPSTQSSTQLGVQPLSRDRQSRVLFDDTSIQKHCFVPG